MRETRSNVVVVVVVWSKTHNMARIADYEYPLAARNNNKALKTTKSPLASPRLSYSPRAANTGLFGDIARSGLLASLPGGGWQS